MTKIDTSAEVAAFLARGGTISTLKPSHTKPPKIGGMRTGNHHRPSKRLARELATPHYQKAVPVPTIEQMESMTASEMIAAANTMCNAAGLEPIPTALVKQGKEVIMTRFKAALTVVERLSD